MGQAFRRAAGRIGSSPVETTSSKIVKPVEPKPPVVPPVNQFAASNTAPGSDEAPRVNEDNLLEDRDQQYDVMLGQMVGSIRSKPGGKLEMGEAHVVEKYKRPMPKLRNTTTDSSRYEEMPAPPGTLNVAQLRQIILLHQGKASDYSGRMDIPQIAERFRIDVALVQNILQSVALPPPPQEDSQRKKNQE